MNRQQGIALLLVMLLLALMATLAVNINQHWYAAFSRTVAQQSRILAKWQLLGGETVARLRLAQSLQGETTVHLGQAWAQSGQALDSEEGNIDIAFRDAQACFNLNTLNYQFREPETLLEPLSEEETGPVFKADIARQVFDALLANFDFSNMEIKLIGDSIKNRLTSDKTAFSDISELRQLPGISRERFLQLKPLFCTLVEQKPAININTLGMKQWPLLRALFLNEPSADVVQQLLATRPATGWKSLSDPAFQDALANLRLPPLEGEKLLTTRSHYFYARLTTENEQGDYRLESLLRYEPQNIAVIARQIRQGSEE